MCNSDRYLTFVRTRGATLFEISNQEARQRSGWNSRNTSQLEHLNLKLPGVTEKNVLSATYEKCLGWTVLRPSTV